VTQASHTVNQIFKVGVSSVCTMSTYVIIISTCLFLLASLRECRSNNKIYALCFSGSEKVLSMCSTSVINPFQNISAFEEVS
jgi:hypothetical protein